MSSLSEILNAYSFELSGNPCWGFIIKDTRKKMARKCVPTMIQKLDYSQIIGS